MTDKTVKQQLADILTSDQYSNSEEITTRVPKIPEESDDSSWLADFLGELLDWLFDFDAPENLIEIGSMLLKGLLIVALLLAIVWVIKNSEGLLGWIQQKSWRLSKHKIQIEDYQQSHLAQGWENLPEHQQIVEVVRQLLMNNQYLPAMSILYRGSLRWLNENKLLAISPANTEMQCLNHIKRIQQIHTINTHSAEYIIDIIRQWIPIAYDEDFDMSNQLDKTALIHLADNWQARLPLQLSLTRQQEAS